MKHVKRRKTLTDTKVFLFILGLSLKIGELIKDGFIYLYNHITEVLIFLSFGGMIFAAEAFDRGWINTPTVFLFIIVLGILIVTLLRVKILESRSEND